MPALFDNVQAAPPDAILGLTEAFRSDPNPKKVNLSVGVYQDAHGKTPVLRTVKAAEARILKDEDTKGYMPIGGDPGYGALVQTMLFGGGGDVAESGRAFTFDTPGGTGALRVAADYLHNAHNGTTLWLSDPTWPNHPGVFSAAGLPLKTYPYFDSSTNQLDLDAMLAALSAVGAGDVVVLHACCHNPTGVDPDVEQWNKIADLLNERNALPLVDFAYQGFADGLEEDAAGLRAIAGKCPELIVCSSFSKNFGLYRERVGAMTVVAGSAAAAAAVKSQASQAVRRNYSNPPAHGALVVRAIMEDDKLRDEWQVELAEMRNRINGMRSTFADALTQRGVKLSPTGNAFVTTQRGMFTMTGLTKDHVAALREKFAIYVVGSGRINVAGLTDANVAYVADAIAEVVGD